MIQVINIFLSDWKIVYKFNKINKIKQFISILLINLIFFF
jgi:hypothetical protein